MIFNSKKKALVEGVEQQWKEVQSKQVYDSDGFLTDYTWYTNGAKHIFMFGDKDLYQPDEAYADWEVEIYPGNEANADAEAQEWFDSYTGFEDELDESLDEAVVTGGNYTITYYLNTAGRERRPETAEDVENDYKSENFTCADDFSAMLQAYLVRQEDRHKYSSNEDILQAYELDFTTVEDVKEYFDFCDISDGSVIILKVEQNDRVVYESDLDLDYFMNGIEESLDEEHIEVNECGLCSLCDKYGLICDELTEEELYNFGIEELVNTYNSPKYYCVDTGESQQVVIAVSENGEVTVEEDTDGLGFGIGDRYSDSDEFINSYVGLTNTEGLTETRATGARGRYQVEVFDEGDWHKLNCWSTPQQAIKAGEAAVEAVYQDYRVVDKESGEEVDIDDYSDDMNESVAMAAITGGILTGLARAVGASLLPALKRLLKKNPKKAESKWIDYKGFLIEETPEKAIHIYDKESNRIRKDIEFHTMKQAKQFINDLVANKKGQSKGQVLTESSANEYDEFQRIIYGSKRFEFEGTKLILTNYRTGHRIALDLENITAEMFEELFVEDEGYDEALTESVDSNEYNKAQRRAYNMLKKKNCYAVIYAFNQGRERVILNPPLEKRSQEEVDAFVNAFKTGKQATRVVVDVFYQSQMSKLDAYFEKQNGTRVTD